MLKHVHKFRPAGSTQAAKTTPLKTSQFNLGAQAVCTLQPQIELFLEYNFNKTQFRFYISLFIYFTSWGLNP